MPLLSLEFGDDSGYQNTSELLAVTIGILTCPRVGRGRGVTRGNRSGGRRYFRATAGEHSRVPKEGNYVPLHSTVQYSTVQHSKEAIIHNSAVQYRREATIYHKYSTVQYSKEVTVYHSTAQYGGKVSNIIGETSELGGVLIWEVQVAL